MQPGQTMEQCKMDQARIKRQTLDQSKHRHKVMLTMRQDFLQKFKTKSYQEAN